VTRKTIDCRTMPSDSNCTVQISGDEDEVLELAAAHAVAVHGHTDDEELRAGLRRGMRDEDMLTIGPGAFLQTIEFHSRDLDRFSALVERWRSEIGAETTGRWALISADRDRPDTYMEVVAFPDFDSAMRNSEHPATTRFAKDLQEATEGEASFRNLDVRAVMVV
jgi:Protein of unknown function (DUF1059)